MDRNHIYQKQSVLRIDEEAIAGNVQAIRSCVKGELIAIVKENGYGIGLEREYTILNKLDIRYFGVTNTEEALCLREMGCEKTILMMTPILNPYEARQLIGGNITLALESEEQAAMLTELGRELSQLPRVHIKLETGMGRYGFRWDSLPDMKRLTDGLLVEGCFSHLAGMPGEYEKQVQLQKKRFLTAVQTLEAQGVETGLKHLCNTSATMTFGDLGLDAVRVGSALLGKAASSRLAKLNTAVWLEAPVYEIRHFRKGDTIGYQSTLTLDKDADLALVRVGHGDGVFLGYADTPEPGLSSAAKHAAAVLLRPERYRKYAQVNGRKVPVMGRLGIAHMMLDVTGLDTKAGDIVRLEVNPLLVHPAVPRRMKDESIEA